ncbi:MAG: hypothetical protein EA359_12205 [Balneolaceae bacterium]|nr:MAG: hypothetical protein EA359_12205 [Balneolaceae bacterium]
MVPITSHFVRNFFKYAQKRVSFYRFKHFSIYWVNYVKNNFKYIKVAGMVPGESEYIEKWKIGGFKPSPEFFRCYSSHFKNNNGIEFAPADILYFVILKILNPVQHRILFSDKNLYDIRYDPSLLPETYFRKMNGVTLSADYKPMETDEIFIQNLSKKTSKIIIKPAEYSRGGKNVERFRYNASEFVNDNNIRLDKRFLDHTYKDNYIAQECIVQHPYLAKFNKSSLNTLRVITYRSVSDNEVKILGTYLRYGNTGSVVDNFSAGGHVMRIKNSGKLSEFAIDSTLNKIFNAGQVKFCELGDYPHYDLIIAVSKKIAKQNPYQRVLGLDVVLDKQNCVKLIEVNNREIDGFQICGRPFFGEYTDEVIAYCRDQLVD